MLAERANPTGEPAFPEQPAAALSFCGLLGFEFLLGIVGLAALRFRGNLRRVM